MSKSITYDGTNAGEIISLYDGQDHGSITSDKEDKSYSFLLPKGSVSTKNEFDLITIKVGQTFTRKDNQVIVS